LIKSSIVSIKLQITVTIRIEYLVSKLRGLRQALRSLYATVNTDYSLGLLI